jgi:cyclophilin family peptidyl-prolyl cis-trans isomerase
MKICACALGALTVAVSWLGGPATPMAQAQDGIFADFATSLGNFTCQLDYTNAPMATANFIGLASGQRAWLDAVSGQVRTNAFYAGLTFHRVIAGFMIQGGSPNGLGTDGPGYFFPDEFTPLLRFDAPGVLAMANSGPDSNGSQFFVTVNSTPWLNDVHTIFGRVVSGLPVVYAISQVATNTSSKPLTNVVMQSVSIRRVGSAAQAFNIQAQKLPVVSTSALSITRGAGSITLNFTNSTNGEVFLRTSTNLVGWTNSSLGVDLTQPVLTNAQRAATAPAQCYALSRVQYASSTFAPRTFYSRTLALNISGLGTLVNYFNSTGGGTFSFGGSSGVILGYNWTQNIYRGSLWPIQYDWFYLLTLQLTFTSTGGGTFSGQAYNPYTWAYAGDVTGTFTLAPP